MEWIKVNSENDIPENLIDSEKFVFLKLNDVTFIGCFYKSYGGINYKSDYDSVPNEIKGIHIGSVKILQAYKEIE